MSKPPSQLTSAVLSVMGELKCCMCSIKFKPENETEKNLRMCSSCVVLHMNLGHDSEEDDDDAGDGGDFSDDDDEENEESETERKRKIKDQRRKDEGYDLEVRKLSYV